jgi:hypothetical protein
MEKCFSREISGKFRLAFCGAGFLLDFPGSAPVLSTFYAALLACSRAQPAPDPLFLPNVNISPREHSALFVPIP